MKGGLIVACFSMVLMSSAVRAETVLVITEASTGVDNAALELVKVSVDALLKKNGWMTRPPFEIPVDLKALLACFGKPSESACIQKMMAPAPNVARVVVVKIEADGPLETKPTYKLRGIAATRNGSNIWAEEGWCERCDSASLDKESESFARRLLQGHVGNIAVSITTDPPDAEVHVDGIRQDHSSGQVTMTPFEVHAVSVTKPGYHSKEQTIHVQPPPAAPPAVKVSLTSNGQAVPVDPETKTSRFGGWKWGVLGGGIAIAATGVILWQVVDKPPSSDGREPRRWNVPGYVLMGTGAVVLGVGIWMVVTDAKSPDAETPTPGVSWSGGFLPGGGYVELQGRF